MPIFHSDGVLAFLEGLVLIASPCILPLLPLILATSITHIENKSRPYLIITGFILSFISFSLLSRKLILFLHIPANAIQIFAYSFLLLLGLILLLPFLDKIFARLTHPLANFAESITQQNSSGIISSLLIGFLIGLIWTPCAGPILAAALIQVITAKTNLDVIIIISAFTLGTALPLLIITLFGQQLIKHIRLFSGHLLLIRKLMGIIIIIFAVSGLFQFNISAWLITPAKAQTSAPLEFQTAPPIEGITQWFNTKPIKPEDLKGKVVLVDFWTYSCVNCIRTMPYLKSWYEKYKNKNFIIIGVHSPEFPFEMDPKNVEAAIKDLKIPYPVAMDNNYVTWTNFHNQYWPAHYIISPDNKLVYSHFGEGDYEETENVIRELLHLKKAESIYAETPKGPLSQTPETYLGYGRTRNFASPQGIKADQLQKYTFPNKLDRNYWALEGMWSIQKDHITSESKNASLMLYFTSKKVYLVLGNKNTPSITAKIKLNGVASKNITVQEHKLYELVNQPSVQNGIIEITADSPGLEAYAFTFGL